MADGWKNKLATSMTYVQNKSDNGTSGTVGVIVAQPVEQEPNLELGCVLVMLLLKMGE